MKDNPLAIKLLILTMYKHPCRYFAKYKGIRRPKCGCEPCMVFHKAVKP